MAAPNGNYLLQTPLDRVERHHESFVDLWETKWRPLAQHAGYPFFFGTTGDFEPIVEEIRRLGLREPYDWEQYSQVFRPVGDGLFEKARAAEEAGHLDEASEYYLRSCTVWFIARFPRPLCESQAYAWKKQKEACIKGIRLGGLPVEEVNIPHKTAVAGEDTTIPAFFSVPDGASKARPVPVVVGICGLDAWRTELVALAGMLRRQGVAMVVVEVPGTGDSPALPGDPESPDRQWSSVLDWLDEHEAIDSRKVVAWGISTGGYYAMRVAHTHASRLLGVVSHGGGCHHMFDERWLESVDKREYPHRISEPLSHKFGFQGDFERFKREAGDRFSLLKDGTLDKPCTRLLLVNGTEDSVFPIDDYYLCLTRGSPKEARLIPGEHHLGGQEGMIVVWRWVFDLLGIQADVVKALRDNTFRPKYP